MGAGIIIGLIIYGAIDLAADLHRLKDKPKPKSRPAMPSQEIIMSTMKDVDQVAWIVIVTAENTTHKVNPN